MTAHDLYVRLAWTVSREASGLRVVYEVRNPSSVDIGLFNRIQSFKVDGTASFAPENVYVDLDGETLHLRKMVLPVPEGLRMTARITPSITLLPGGHVFREEFFLETPVAVCNPLRRAHLSLGAPGSAVVAGCAATVTEIVLSVGVFAVDPAWHFTAVSPAHPAVYEVWPTGPAVDHQVVLTQTVRLARPVSVLDYRVVS